MCLFPRMSGMNARRTGCGRWIWALARAADLPTGEAQHVGLFRRQRPDGAKSDGYRAGDVAAGRRFQIPSDTQQYLWMVCDMVEKPAKVAALMAQWLVNGWCRETIFNLKLPMKNATKKCHTIWRIFRHSLMNMA